MGEGNFFPRADIQIGGIVTRITSEELGRGVFPKGRKSNSRIVTRITIDELGRGVLSQIRKIFDCFTQILYCIFIWQNYEKTVFFWLNNRQNVFVYTVHYRGSLG